MSVAAVVNCIFSVAIIIILIVILWLIKSGNSAEQFTAGTNRIVVGRVPKTITVNGNKIENPLYARLTQS